MSPAMPFWGSRERRLKKGDLVFIDVHLAWMAIILIKL
jgi:hypothetical protein